jgi:hypothetical protein
MTFEFIELGSSPANENCVQVSKTQDYQNEMKKECKAYSNQIKRVMLANNYNIDNLNIRIFTKGFEHDFGMYYEVVIKYPYDIEEACNAAYWCEANLPLDWDEQAKIELNKI